MTKFSAPWSSSAGSLSAVLEDAEDARAQRDRVVERVQRERVLLGARRCGRSSAAIRPPARARRRRRAGPSVVVTAWAARSTESTSASMTSTFWSSRNSLRSERRCRSARAATSPPGRAAAGTGGSCCGRRSVTRTSSCLASCRAQPTPANPPPRTTTCSRPSPDSGGSGRLRGAEALEQVVADAQGVGHRGQRRVHGADAREEARVDDVEVVELVGLAVGVEHRRRRVGAEPARARLVRDARDRDLVLHVALRGIGGRGCMPEVAEHRLELVVAAAAWAPRWSACRRAGRCRRRAASRGCRAAAGPRWTARSRRRGGRRSSSVQLRRQPGLQRLLAPEHLGRGLADHLDVPQRVVDVVARRSRSR